MMQVNVFDVGHGACAIVTCPNGRRIMIDCGFRLDPGWFPSVTFGGEWIDLLVLNNLDEDHVQDFPYVCRHVRLGSIFSNPTIGAHALAAMKREHGMGAGVRTAHAILNRYGPGLIGRPASIGDVRAWAYWNSYGMDFVDTNNLSLAVFVEYGRFTMLFAGDLETAGWRALLQRPGFASDLARVNVFVASHHGRTNGRCEEVFDVCNPDVFVISDYEHRYDSQDTTSWYRDRARGIPDLRLSPHPLWGYTHRYVLTTRREGTLSISVSPDGRYVIATEHGPVLPMSALFGLTGTEAA